MKILSVDLHAVVKMTNAGMPENMPLDRLKVSLNQSFDVWWVRQTRDQIILHAR